METFHLEGECGVQSFDIKRSGSLTGKAKYSISNGQEIIMTGFGDLNIFIINRSFELKPCQDNQEGLIMQTNGPIIGWRSFDVSTSSGHAVAVIKGTADLLGTKFIICEKETDEKLFSVRQKLSCGYRKIKYEIYNDNSDVVGMIVKKTKKIGTLSHYVLHMQTPVDDSTRNLLLSTIFYLEDRAAVSLVRKLTFYLIVLLIMALVWGTFALSNIIKKF